MTFQKGGHDEQVLVSHQAGDRLVNEAIKRILLDIVVRGHGDRLIGRWSREPELQQFLEQVPYMLDRINQLHLACSRCDLAPTARRSSSSSVHHHHHHYHHHHADTVFSSSQSSLSDFINLIGTDRHWLVRTRDPLGLTPLHKAVLFNNRPIVEYILDRYPDELAASGGVHQQQLQGGSTDSKRYSRNQVATRLINAQDKYGRSALHYAAAQLAEDRQASSKVGIDNQTYQLYNFLVAKGASLMVQDFRGKTPPHYVRHSNQLRAKSIIHLANKLSANYQANVLSKTLRANNERAPISEQDYLSEEPHRNNSYQASADNWRLQANNMQETISCHRESMSLSCNDLTKFPQTNCNTKSDICLQEQGQVASGQELDRKRSRSTVMNSSDDHAVGLCTDKQDGQQPDDGLIVPATNGDQPPVTGGSQSISPVSRGSVSSMEDTQVDSFASGKTINKSINSRGPDNISVCLKELTSDRCLNGMVIDQRTKQVLKRALNDGVIDRINDLLSDGYGNYLVDEASTSCWNQSCKRYINQVIPNLLAKLDRSHELVASNQLITLKNLLNNDPILARIRRPYRRAAMSALHVAVWFDRRSIVKYLVNRFPELVGQRDSHGATCLHWAAKCLRHDRLYCWLLEHFGHQLEQVRDWRGKSALDYRQQAFRLSNFAENHPQTDSTLSKKSVDARDILRSTQKASDRIQFKGNKVNLHNRATPAPLNLTPTTTRVERVPSSVPTADEVSGRCSEETGDLDKSIEIGAELDSFRNEVAGKKVEESQLEDDTTFRVSNCETVNTPVASVAHVKFFQDEDQSEKLTGQARDIARKVSSLSAANSLERDNLSEQLLGEMVQLESSELQANDETFEIFSEPSENGSRPVTPSLPLSRPQSASYTSTLESMIESCMVNDDFKKIEHLILAGCGDKLLKLYTSRWKSPATHSMGQHKVAELSLKMREFCEKRAPEYIDRIAQIHHVLHRCFADPLRGGPNVIIDPYNNIFHKLCNLLVRRRLIMSRDRYGASPLHVGLMRADKRLVDYLLRRHPEAASAPDHDRRNAIHYAALVLAAYEAHGSFDVTINRANSSPEEDQLGFWKVDESVEVMYSNLIARYSELLELKDRKGLTGTEYLIKSANLSSEHVCLGEITDEFAPADVLSSCCPEYAQLLARYNYVILTRKRSPPIEYNAKLEEKEEGNCGPQNQEQVSGGDVASEKPAKKQVSRRAGSCEDTPVNNSSEAGRTSKLSGKQHASARSKTTDNLVRHLDRQVLVPDSFNPLDNVVVRQVAPKPTVGSESGYPLFAGTQSPVYSNIGEPEPAGLLGEQVALSTPLSSASRRHGHSKAGSLLDDLDPNQRSHRTGGHHHQRHHHRGRHRRNRHYHHRRKSVVPAIQSIVGGVIVPTIIHNDKMDEIETYDIIYRRPPAQKQNSTSGSGSSFSSGSSCSLASDISGDSDEGAVSRANSRLAAGKHLPESSSGKAASSSGRSQKNGLVATGSGLSVSAVASPDSSSSSSSSNDEDDEDAKNDVDDDRVERLSNEFENRVRREKSELRAKVDQIMNEIKLSAKSGKSSRFLASPLDFSTCPKVADGGIKNDSTVMFSATSNELSKQNAGKGEIIAKQVKSVARTREKRQSIESHSSGHCSERTYDTSATSSASSSTSSRSSNTGSGSTVSCSMSSLSSKKASAGGSSVSSYSSSALNASSRTVRQPLANKTTKKPPSDAGQQDAQDNALKRAAITTSISELTGQLVSKNTYGQTYLHFIASRSQSASTLYKVLDHGSHLIGERDIFYRTARDVAVQFHLSNNVQVLDKYIIDLFIGANTSLLRHLLNQGYSPLIHVSDTDGNDIMLILKLLKLDRMIHFLLQMADFQRWRDELHTFIRNGYSAGLTELIRKHGDLVRAKSVHSRSSLHLAVLFDRADMAGELIERDPSCVHSTDNMGRTALHYTYGLNLKNVDEIRELLLKNGASLEARDVKMRTPKYYFIFKREIEEIKRIELEFN